MFPESFVRTKLSQDVDDSMRMERIVIGTCEENHIAQLGSTPPAASELHQDTSWRSMKEPTSSSPSSLPHEQYAPGVSTNSQLPASDQRSLAPTKLDAPKQKRPKKTPKIRGWKNTEYSCPNGDGKALTRFISYSEAAGTSS